MEFSRQEYLSGLPFPFPGDLPNPGIKPRFPTLQKNYLPLAPPGKRRQWHPTPLLLPGEPHGWRSLMDYSLWDRKEWDMTEQLHFHSSLSCTGEGNGNPLQYSCQENPRDRSLVGCCLWGCTESDTTDMT